jgi:uncharacterized protein (DUF2267 family)
MGELDMSQAVMEVFDAPIQKTMSWMDELTQMLGWEDPRKTYSVMRVVLHSLRDRLTVQEAAHLGSQLPMLIRGFS